MIHSVIFWLLLLFIIVISYTEFEPYIDRTNNGSIVIWYNWKNKRIFKYLWKQSIEK